jgi:hypothetical protein
VSSPPAQKLSFNFTKIEKKNFENHENDALHACRKAGLLNDLSDTSWQTCLD